MKTFNPDEATLMSTGFTRFGEKDYLNRWRREIIPLSHDARFIIYNWTHNTFRYSRFLLNIRSEEDIRSIVKILSK